MRFNDYFRRERCPQRSDREAAYFCTIFVKKNDLGGIEPPKSFRNAEDSVPYGTLEESDKLKLEVPMEETYADQKSNL